jgi:hypothetical protein
MVVVLSVFRALLRRASAVQRAFPIETRAIGASGVEVTRLRIFAGLADLLARSNPPILAEKMVVGLGDAPSDACMSGR